jgi:hypothetical protein
MHQPYLPSIPFDPGFVVNVIAGWILTLSGVGLLLVAAIWSVAAGEWLRGEPAPGSWRALCTLGVAAFIAGLLWQAVGYYRVGAITW